MTVLFDRELFVSYGHAYLTAYDTELPELADSRRGQSNGLLGAAVPGGLVLTFGLEGSEPLCIEWCDGQPPVNEECEEVVEASFTAPTTTLLLSGPEDSARIELPQAGSMRARLSARGMDTANALPGGRSEHEPAPDGYLLQLWSAEPTPDRILRQTSAIAGVWHSRAQS